MKRFAKISVLLIIAVTVFFTGAGVTIINYCCSSCNEQTLFMTEKHACCAKSVHLSETKSCCSANNENTTANEGQAYRNDPHCTASRLSIDIDASSFRSQVYSPFVWVTNIPFCLTERFPSYNEINQLFFIRFKSPPDISPERYLSIIQTFII